MRATVHRVNDLLWEGRVLEVHRIGDMISWGPDDDANGYVKFVRWFLDEMRVEIYLKIESVG